MHNIHNLQYSSVCYDMSFDMKSEIREVFHSNNKHISFIIHVNGNWKYFKELTWFRSPNLYVSEKCVKQLFLRKVQNV